MKYQARPTGPSPIVRIATRGGVIASAAAIAALGAAILAPGTAKAAPAESHSPHATRSQSGNAAASAITYFAVGSTSGKIENVYSGKYLNVMADTYALGSKVAQWDISGASHETFQFVLIENTDAANGVNLIDGGYLQAEAPDGKWYYVTASGEDQLTLGAQVAHPTSSVLGSVLASDADAQWSPPGFDFPNDGFYFADDSGWSTANGAPVIAYPHNGGTNQQWIMP